MFNNITEKFSKIFRKISNKGRLTEENIKNTLKEIRKTLLEADVSLSVIKHFIHSIKKSAIGNRINDSFTPGQELITIVQKELISILGNTNSKLNLSTIPPAVILIVGLQGSGKTTTTAKLAKFIKTNYKKKILMVSTDTYRPAAIKQLKILSKQISIDFFPSNNQQNPIDIAKESLKYAQLKLYDILLIDTAGRLHIDQSMMQEILDIHQYTNPIETFLVIDAMIGQDSINIASTFKKHLPISGFVVTKTDSDTRAGAIFSITYVTQKPIKFIGTGEKLDEFELFHPNRIAKRILGMGDVLSLIEEIEKKIDKNHLKNFEKKIKHNNSFNFNDILNQIDQVKKIGPIESILNKLPKKPSIFTPVQHSMNENTLIKMKVMILSMTIQERIKPELIKGSRKRRIALGSGLSIQTINQLLKQFNNIKKIMKNIKKNGLYKIMQGINNMLKK